MAISDAVIGNLMMIYVAVIALIKAYSLVYGRSYGGGFVLMVSSTVVGFILIVTLTWDVSRKATYAISRDQASSSSSVHVHEMCKRGICWHGVAVRSPASQVRPSLVIEEIGLNPLIEKELSKQIWLTLLHLKKKFSLRHADQEPESEEAESPAFLTASDVARDDMEGLKNGNSSPNHNDKAILLNSVPVIRRELPEASLGWPSLRRKFSK
ncbi:hypothetical protein REPUB_Repub02eG0017100 [Reevesia pubescens]